MPGRVVFIGAVHEALPALEAVGRHPDAELACVVTIAEAGAASGVVDLAPVAAAAGVPLLRHDDVNSAAGVADVRSFRPDLIVVVGWSRLIGPELLSLPRYGVIGFHASLLPRHRGRAPVNWSLIKGETETGNTMMLLSAGVDSGLIVDQRTIPLYVDDTCATVYDRVAESGADMLTANLGALLRGEATARRQDDDLADYLPKRTAEMGITDWNRSPMDLHNWVRALTHPYPGAFSTLRGERVHLWRTEPPTITDRRGEPGEILAVDHAGMRVAVREGSVVVTHLGGDPVAGGSPAAAWMREQGVAVGDRFDPVEPALARWALGEGARPSVVVA